MALDTLEVYVLKPKQATNLVINPSVEVDTTGYTGTNATISRITSNSRRGVACLQVATQTGVTSGVYFGTIPVSTVAYSKSVDVLAPAGWPMRIQVKSSSDGTVRAEKTFIAKGFWQRISLTYTDALGSTVNLFIVRDSVASTANFYIDGLQFEAGNESTYIDGDQMGYVRYRYDYVWNGTPNASTSTRYACTHGGEMVRLSAYASILAIIGLGLVSWEHAAYAMPSGGSYYQESRELPRDFMIPIQIEGSNYSALAQNRQVIGDLVSPDVGKKSEPITLLLKAVNSSGDQVSEACLIPCVYRGGLEGNLVSQKSEKLALSFTSYLPYIVSDGNRSVALNVTGGEASGSTGPGSFVIGTLNEAGWNADFGWDGQILDIAIQHAPESIYLVGTFLGGKMASLNRICKYNMVTEIASAVGAGANATINVAKFGPDGYLYLGGQFTTANAVSAKYIVKVDVSTNTYSNVGAATALDGYVNDIVWDNDGNLYAGMISGLTYSGIAKFNGSTWSALASGPGGDVFSLVWGNDGKLYAGGNFGGLVKVWNGTAWSLHPAGILSTYPGAHVDSMVFDSRGWLYVAGSFIEATYQHFVYTQGTSWSKVGGGSGIGPDGNVRKVLYDPLDDAILLAGSFTAINGFTLTNDGLARYKLGSYMPMGVDINMTPAYFYALARKDGWTIAAAHTTSTAAWDIDFNNATTVSNPANVAYPEFRIVGPMKLWSISNYTSQRRIYFNNLQVNTGEILTLRVIPGRVEFTSNVRGNMSRYILPGSSLDFRIEKGDNSIGPFDTGASGNAAIYMMWREAFSSLDNTVK